MGAGRGLGAGWLTPSAPPSSGVSVTVCAERTAVSIGPAKGRPPGLAAGSDPRQACSLSGNPGALGSPEEGGPKG